MVFFVGSMERFFQVFESFGEAEEADLSQRRFQDASEGAAGSRTRFPTGSSRR
jgi:hypothetical protein